jgi:hypothetical protein
MIIRLFEHDFGFNFIFQVLIIASQILMGIKLKNHR